MLDSSCQTLLHILEYIENLGYNIYQPRKTYSAAKIASSRNIVQYLL